MPERCGHRRIAIEARWRQGRAPTRSRAHRRAAGVEHAAGLTRKGHGRPGEAEHRQQQAGVEARAAVQVEVQPQAARAGLDAQGLAQARAASRPPEHQAGDGTGQQEQARQPHQHAATLAQQQLHVQGVDGIAQVAAAEVGRRNGLALAQHPGAGRVHQQLPHARVVAGAGCQPDVVNILRAAGREHRMHKAMWLGGLRGGQHLGQRPGRAGALRRGPVRVEQAVDLRAEGEIAAGQAHQHPHRGQHEAGPAVQPQPGGAQLEAHAQKAVPADRVQRRGDSISTA
mmetsp:Transcript_65311/g.154283  ORF Transcript_65311/g.154283 Transcript_65311/m.154283 type:complete len:285 (+) Transcript_65311:712-1566(+)